MTALLTTSNKPSDPVEETNTGVIEFVAPVANATVLKGYSATELQFNSAMKEWSIHKAIDFGTSSGANVMACYDGTVESIETNILEGTVITINHGNNLKSVYKSLDENVKVSVGENIKTGQVLSTASSSSSGETIDNSQVHFEVWKDDKLVDPAGYLNLDNK